MTTLVHFFVTVRTTSGTRVASPGVLRLRRHESEIIPGNPTEEVLNTTLSMPLDAEGKASVPLSTGHWGISLHDAPPGTWTETVWVFVPDQPEADYKALTQVDPTTLAPAAEPEAAWWALWDAMAAGTYLVPDPANVGLYIPTDGNAMTPDPAHSGLYTIGALA